MQKILSIIIPTYNAEKFLDKGLPSFIMDDESMMDKLEILVVNDGTPDNSVAVAQKYVDRYPDTFKILSKENGGHGSAINAGVRQITGKYFKVVDADDWVDTDTLEKVIKLMEAEDFDAMISSFRTYDISHNPAKEEPWDIKIPESIDRPDHIYSLKEIMDNWWDVQCAMTFHGVFYNTQFYKQQNYELVEGVFYEDQEFATVPLSRAESVKLLTDEFYVYRIGDVNQSVSQDNLFRRLPDSRAVILRLLEFDKKVDQCPEGGMEYWLRKESKIIADIYCLTLIRCRDKKKYRGFCKELTREIQKGSERVYNSIKLKYKVFKLLNRLHMSQDFYDNKFMKLLEKVRK